ncbi:lysophosphatidic acid receptor 6 [Engraulis encrasicolus]|uniref:lysophosphatidic acid receptor 6 n=1 Tax=Engraulis encrasicolus TaxID=184585 RepID=UPI002FD5DCA4
MKESMLPNATATPQTQWEQCINRTADKVEFVFVSVYVLVFIAGLILNLVALAVFFCLTKTRSHTTVYMTNLAVADLLLVCMLPVRIYYHLGFRRLPQLLCEVTNMVLLMNMYGSILLLSCMSVDRAMAVCFPMSARVRQTRKKAPLACLVIWLLTVSTSVPIYISRAQGSQQAQCFGSFPAYATRTVVVSSSLTLGFGGPLIALLVSSWGLIRAVRQSQAAQMDLVDTRKIQRMVAACLLIFLACFLPYHLSLWLIYVNRTSVPCSLVDGYRYGLMVACLNAMLDPLAYYFTTETFRQRVGNSVRRQMRPITQGQSSDDNNRSRALNT